MFKKIMKQMKQLSLGSSERRHKHYRRGSSSDRRYSHYRHGSSSDRRHKYYYKGSSSSDRMYRRSPMKGSKYYKRKGWSSS